MLSGFAIGAVAALLAVATAGAAPLPTTREDFKLPGTQPLTITESLSTPAPCVSCHSGYGEPEVEPFRNWQGSMMAQAGRDPLMWAALAISNQYVPQSGETCLRCHLPKGWLEGRSFLADGTLMTADDRQGVQCTACHRMVDPVSSPENPAADTAILAALGQPVPAVGGAMMVIDPLERLRGPFDIIADLGSDPHLPERSTLVSPFHSDARMCGTCHNLRNPIFTKNSLTGEWVLDPMGVANPDPSKGFPEQSTFDEWLASEYAAGGVEAPQFGGNKTVVSTCQDCHMPDVTGRDANLGVTRTDLPLHTFAGANTFIPAVLPFHPAFGSEVDAALLQEGVAHSTAMLRKAATLTGTLDGGVLTVRVTNESGHKLPTGYPEGRRMWLHVRALDAKRNLVFESGRYVFATATLSGHGAEPSDPEHDPHLHVWEAEQGISAEVAALVGLPPGRSFHLSLNNVRIKDNRIPPRGFTNAAFAALDAEPVGATYADGQYWDEVAYPVGPAATRAEVTLYYQTASREYVEFLRDENTTTAAGVILFDLWEQHNKSVPVEMARLTVETDAGTIAKCSKSVATARAKYLKAYYKEWSRCFALDVKGLVCDSASRNARIGAAEASLRERLGGVKDRACGGRSLTPGSLGHEGTCPAPCDSIVLFDMNDLATCSLCLTEELAGESLHAAYGARPPDRPGRIPAAAESCQKLLDSAAGTLAMQWTKAVDKCEQARALGRYGPAVDCAGDPDGKVAGAKDNAAGKIDRCTNFAGIGGCAVEGNAAAVGACVEASVGALVPPYTRAAYP
jgi:hypothetical protein